MSLRQLVEGDCGGVNPLMQFGGHFMRDAARKEEGFASAQLERSLEQDEQMVNDFLGQIAAQPQSFQMATLLQEMREIEQANAAHTQMLSAPRIIDEVTRGKASEWTAEFGLTRGSSANTSTQQQITPENIIHMEPQRQEVTLVNEFFDEATPAAAMNSFQSYSGPNRPYLAICPPYQPTVVTEQFFESENINKASENQLPEASTAGSMEDWIKDYQKQNEGNEEAASSYSDKFWERLQNEWQKLSEDSEHTWLSEYDENYDLYKEYSFVEENPMSEVNNAFERGKQYLAMGDVPSAVLCFEVAAKREPGNAEIWEHLGIAQAENEMDPQGIAALKRSLDIRPDNMRVLMALAVCYTNESLHSHALKMLANWLQVNPKYRHLVEQHSELHSDSGSMASSLISGDRLRQVQNLFLEAVRQQPQEVDADVQEALGVLYNLSSEYNKAADCFRAALHVNPENAKVWNRLGASLANGSRSVEAVEAYQRALQLEPGFIRVRYNVGVCCLNLKAYKQAAEHLLTALNMQANTAALKELSDETGASASNVASRQQRMSETIWSTLKMTLSLMDRSDLQGHVNDRNLNALNEAFQE